MNRIQRITALLLVCSGNMLFAADSLWETDFEAARSRAAEKKKDLLIDFTGSDWCSWCILLRKEVFDKVLFQEKAPEDFVLVELDYPKDQSILAEKLQEQNRLLLEKYPITGYPTILLCDASGKPFAATGYQAGGPDAYLPHLAELHGRKAARDEAFEKAGTLEGVAKAKILVAALEALELPPAMVANAYPEIIGDITKADPEDETGFAAAANAERQLQNFLQTLGGFRSKGDIDGAVSYIDGLLADEDVKGPFRQQIYGHKAGTLATAGKKAEAIAVLETAVADDPDGERTAELADFIKILQKEIEREKAAPKN